MFLALIIAVIIYMRIEAGMLKVKRVYFTKKKACLKIVHISDIHIKKLKVSQSRIAEAIRNEKPDIVIATGDYIEKPGQAEDFFEFFKRTLNGYRVIMCLGNHDYKSFRGDDKGLAQFVRSLESLGATVLDNKSFCFEKYPRKYNIIGLADLKSGRPVTGDELNLLRSAGHTNIAISHNPDIALEIPHGIVDYLFCGHFHGGQIWAPFNFEFRILRHDRLCRMGIVRGLHKVNGIMVYINRGLGNVIVPFRFMSWPELTVYHIP